jgi:hypothetical protein
VCDAHTAARPSLARRLFAFTRTIDRHDLWVRDHEAGWGGETFIAGLASLWRLALGRDDRTLGIDSEFTRPGLVQMLGDFQRKVEAIQFQKAPLGSRTGVAAPPAPTLYAVRFRFR